MIRDWKGRPALFHPPVVQSFVSNPQSLIPNPFLSHPCRAFFESGRFDLDRNMLDSEVIVQGVAKLA